MGGAGCMGSGMIDEKRPVFHLSQGEGETYKACLNYYGNNPFPSLSNPPQYKRNKNKNEKSSDSQDPFLTPKIPVKG